MHIVDELILERATRLRSFPLLWKLLQPSLYSLLGYNIARRTADAVCKMSGFDAFSYVSNELGLQTKHSGLEQIPTSGRCVIICNHPTGLADGIAVFDILREHRPDMLFLANADALRVVPKGTDIVLPVEWVAEKRTREKTRATLNGFKQAMQEERCVVIFPAGALAKLSLSGLVEPPWETSATSLARKYRAPIIPVNMSGNNSFLYYLFCILNTELRDITLFHELLNKRNKLFTFEIGAPICPQTMPKKAAQATEFIKQVVTEQLAVTE